MIDLEQLFPILGILPRLTAVPTNYGIFSVPGFISEVHFLEREVPCRTCETVSRALP